MPLAEWDNFYVVVGSSAAALTGLMFVVVTLIVERRSGSATGRQIDAFATPTVVHFSAVLLQAAILSAPWRTLGGARTALGVFGGTAVVYMLIVLRRAHRQTEYKPVFEDWLFHTALPLVAYLAIVVSVWAMPRSPESFLFVLAGAALLLLFVGIHNAWDTVTFIVVAGWEKRPADESAPIDRTETRDPATDL
ncbi:MAG TPA: hypothetical protein VNG89_23850 [Vicinamibacterales bacterium]|nr:hypothetical protein [Vicinamibacterales bacterium]